MGKDGIGRGNSKTNGYDQRVHAQFPLGELFRPASLGCLYQCASDVEYFVIDTGVR